MWREQFELKLLYIPDNFTVRCGCYPDIYTRGPDSRTQFNVLDYRTKLTEPS